MNHRIRHKNLKIAAALLGGGLLSTVAAAQEAGAGNTALTWTYVAIAVALFLTIILHFAALPVVHRVLRYLARRRVQSILADTSIDVLSDFILPGAYDGLTRIDYAALTTTGVLCIRALHCDGVVSGAAGDPQWLHEQGSARRRFLNPRIQNDGHVKAMKNIVPDMPVANLVVFSGSTRFAAPQEDNVVHVSALREHVARLASGAAATRPFGDAWQKLRQHALTDPATRKDLEAQLSFG